MECMRLTTEEIDHLAKLAHLALSDDERAKFRAQLSSVLDYVAKLQRVNTSSVPPTAQVTGQENVWREDRVIPSDPWTHDLLIKNMPEQSGNLLKVKGVL